MSAPSVSSLTPPSDLRRKKGHGRCFTDHLEEIIEILQGIDGNIQALLTILKNIRLQELASMKVNPASEDKWKLPLEKSFGSKKPKPLSWVTCIGSACILMLAILSVYWSSFWKIPPSAAALDMSEFSTLMRTWAGAAMKGLSEEFSAGQEA